MVSSFPVIPGKPQSSRPAAQDAKRMRAPHVPNMAEREHNFHENTLKVLKELLVDVPGHLVCQEFSESSRTGSHFGKTFGNPNFIRYTESYGDRGSRVTATRGLAPALDAAFDGGGVSLVDVPIDYSENVGVPIDERKHRVNEFEVA